MDARAKRPRGTRPALRPPVRLVVETFDVGDQAFAILEWPTAERQPHDPLPPAQREVLDLVLAGRSNAEIARVRRRSVRTIANQVASIFRRLGVGSRLEVFALFAQGGARSSTRGDP